jgi:PiT family inorganic phosphate transporter
VHRLQDKSSFAQVEKLDRNELRYDLYLVSKTINRLNHQNDLASEELGKSLVKLQVQINKATKYVPDWIKPTVALALASGTLIGWRRVVVTLGEKIGHDNLSYVQGAVSEMVTTATIFAGDYYGLPVSTTHVLSSGIAGTMVANNSGINTKTILSIVLAWILTLPVCMILGSSLFIIVLFLSSFVIKFF